jgi:glutamine synthetase
MSETMRHFVGGQRALMPELLAMVAANVNSYRRLIPGFWAPTGGELGRRRTARRRCASSRARPSRRASSTASPPPTRTPTLALAAAVGSGLWGIENKVDPGRADQGQLLRDRASRERQLPRTLMEAAGRLKASKAARDLFGDSFVDHYSATREWEEREFRKAITGWELDRYMEII